jgi:hypothetical protein
MPVQLSDFNLDILPSMMKGDSLQNWDAVDSHRLAIICAVLAIGTFHDLDNTDYDIDSKYWYNLGRAALSLHCVMEHPSIPGIQALVSTRDVIMMLDSEAK